MRGVVSWISLCLSALCAAQSLVVPDGWRNPAFTVSRQQRIAVAGRSIALMVQNVSLPAGMKNMDPWQVAHVFTAITMKDYIAGTTTQQLPMTQTLSSLAAGPGFVSAPFNDPTLQWMMACIYAYRAYNNLTMLQLAENAWPLIASYQITEANVQAGTHPLRTFHLPSTCNGQTTAGAVFADYGPSSSNSSRIQIITTGALVVVAAHLAELTKNQTYLDAAVLAANFVLKVMVTPSNLILEGLDIMTCQLDPTNVGMQGIGLVAHGMSVLADVTQDSQWRELAAKTLVAGSQSPLWASTDGIAALDPGQQVSNDNSVGVKGDYIGALYEMWARSSANATLLSYIGAYVAVQYNALQQLASTGTSGYYSGDWHGPAVNYWTRAGIMASAGALVAAIGPANFNTSTTSSSPSSATSTSSATSSPSPSPLVKHLTAAVIAGVVIAFFLLCAVLIGVLLWLRHRRGPHMRVRPYGQELLPLDDLAIDKYPPPSPMMIMEPTSQKRREAEMLRSGPVQTPGASTDVSQVSSSTRLVQVVYEVQPDGTLREQGHPSDGDLPPYDPPRLDGARLS